MKEERIIQVRLWVYGRVQGVGFRYFTQQAAQRLRITGWVSNVSDGDVEILAQGDTANILEFQRVVKSGPPMSAVSQVIAEIQTPTETYATFEIQPTK